MINFENNTAAYEGSKVPFKFIKVGKMFTLDDVVYRKVSQTTALSVHLKSLVLDGEVEVEMFNRHIRGAGVSEVGNRCKFRDIQDGTLFSEDGEIYYRHNESLVMSMSNFLFVEFEADDIVNQSDVTDFNLSVVMF